MNILLVDPDFPIPPKSKNKCYFLPIGLLKIGSYHKQQGDCVQLVRGNVENKDIRLSPDVIMITSLFTYWSQNVIDTTCHYRKLFPAARIIIGGIWASLMPEKCIELTGADEISVGLYKNGTIEGIDIDYSLLDNPIDYQIIHASRGCFRKCNFCGTWRIEKDVIYKTSIINEIKKNNLIFYDNNILANPNIENILKELSMLKVNNRNVYSECQSGLDGRILIKQPHLAKLLKTAHFGNPRIAWDGGVKLKDSIKEQIAILKHSGYKANRKDSDIYIFMLFNHDIPYDEMCKKLDYCQKWGVLVVDCRYRPLDSLSDNYAPRKKSQPCGEYYIHSGWTDGQVRGFRRKVRQQNIAIRLGLPGNKYIQGVERGFVAI